MVIATPGRLIDHVHNAPGFSLHQVEILVLDEADRMLDEYFAEQMNEVIRLCSRQRQTMLFSATMSDEVSIYGPMFVVSSIISILQVNDLARVSLDKPAKLFVDDNATVARGVQQEFIRVRASREGDREAIVAGKSCRIIFTLAASYMNVCSQRLSLDRSSRA